MESFIFCAVVLKNLSLKKPVVLKNSAEISESPSFVSETSKISRFSLMWDVRKLNLCLIGLIVD